MHRILVTRLLPPLAQQRLREWAAACDENIELIQWPHYDKAIPRHLLLDLCRSGLDGILCLLSDRIDDAVLQAAGERLRVVSTMSVGVDHIDTGHPAFHRQQSPVLIGHTPGVLTDDCADLCVALVLALGRRLIEAARVVRDREWPADFSPVWLLGKPLIRHRTIGVYGMGRIGRAVCHRLLPFQPTRIIYCRSTTSTTTTSTTDNNTNNNNNNNTNNNNNNNNNNDNNNTVANDSWQQDQQLLDISRLGGYGLKQVCRVTFEELLRESDLILITAALTSETRNAFNASAFQQMRSTAVLVNVARGPIVNTADLQQALLCGTIAAAALDVCDPEPLDCERFGELLTMPDRCLIVPHISSATVDTRERMAQLALDNLEAAIMSTGADEMPHRYPCDNCITY